LDESLAGLENPVERTGPSIEFKVVLLVAAAVIAQDLVLLAMHLSGAPALAVQATLGGLLVLALLVAAVWGNAVARAVRRLTRACFVARHGDTSVLAELTRTDELGQLNEEINRLVVTIRGLMDENGRLSEGTDVADTAEGIAPELVRSSHGIMVSLKELREGASAEIDIMRKVSGRLAEVRATLAQIAAVGGGSRSAAEAGTRLQSLTALSREIELLADAIIDEVARPSIEEAALARAVNGVRDAARAMAEVASQAADPLARALSDREAAGRALERLDDADHARADAARVAELMSRSAGSGVAEGGRLAAALRRLGVVLESYARAKRVP
jgi:methyl-accepting chemotaxis protein